MKSKNLLGFALVLPLAACGVNRGEGQSSVKLANQRVDAKQLAADNNLFALAIFRELAGSKRENAFIAPYSIYSALGMTFAGARGETASAMAQTLNWKNKDSDTIHESFSALNKSMIASKEVGGYDLNIANRLWGEQTYKFRPDFLLLTKTRYEAELQPLNFKGNSNGSRETINQWVEEQTNDKIKELLADGIIKPTTRLVLTNAVYFNGEWKSKFDEKRTEVEGKFSPLGIRSIENVPMMHQEGQYRHGQIPSLKTAIVSLPYATKEGSDKQISMYVLLPQDGTGVVDLQAKLTPEVLDEAISTMTEKHVILTLPRFKVEGSYGLSDALKKLGMEIAFDEQRADFSGMADVSNGNLFISDAVHKTFINVFEGGTEAAGATAIVVGVRGAIQRPVIFNVKHSFMYLIRDDSTGAILFLGKVVTLK